MKGCGCNTEKMQSGVYGFDTSGLMDDGLMLVSAFGGYVAAQKIDQTVTYLKDNVKTSGLLWTGGSLLVNVMFPQMAQNKMVKGASIGMGLYGLKQLNKGYDILKGVNGLDESNNYAAQYQQRMAQAQAQARLQAQQAAQLPPSGGAQITHNRGERTVLQMRLAA